MAKTGTGYIYYAVDRYAKLVVFCTTGGVYGIDNGQRIFFGLKLPAAACTVYVNVCIGRFAVLKKM